MSMHVFPIAPSPTVMHLRLSIVFFVADCLVVACVCELVLFCCYFCFCDDWLVIIFVWLITVAAMAELGSAAVLVSAALKNCA